MNEHELEQLQRELAECRQRIEQLEGVLAREVSGRRQSEEKLNQLNAELAQQAAELRALNQTLADREHCLRIAIETGRIGLFVWDSTQLTNPGDWSRQLKEIFGLPLEAEVTHDMFLKCVHPEDREHIDQCVMRALQGENGGQYNTEYRTIKPDDASEHWVTARGQAFFNVEGKAIRFIGTVMDITDRKRAELSLSRVNIELEERISERLTELARTNLALESEIAERKRTEMELRRSERLLAEGELLSDTGSGIWNLRTGEMMWSANDLRMLGLGPNEEASVELFLERVHPDERALLSETIARETEARRAYSLEYRIVMPDGSLKHFHTLMRPIVKSTGEVEEYVGVSRDITERKRAEDRLRRSEAFLAEGQRISHTGSWELNISTGEVVWSDESYHIFGYNPDEVEPDFALFVDRVHPDDRIVIQQMLDGAIAEGRGFSCEFRIVLPDGSIKHIQTRGHPTQDGSGPNKVYVGANLDITATKRAEEALRQAQSELAHLTRVTTMGELAASIAHEVSQPIAGVVINGIACLRWLDKGKDDPVSLAEAREAVQRIVRDGKRAGDVIGRIRTLFKKAETAKEPLDLNEAIREIIILTRSEMDKRRVAPRLELVPDLPRVLGDRVQLQQVMMNLILNAIEAMSTVEDRPRELVIGTQVHDQGKVLVTVRDSGPGLDPESTEKVFAAFHTTKPGGLGMGLSISRSIVENHSGQLWVTANDGPGVAFQFTLSAASAKAGEESGL